MHWVLAVLLPNLPQGPRIYVVDSMEGVTGEASCLLFWGARVSALLADLLSTLLCIADGEDIFDAMRSLLQALQPGSQAAACSMVYGHQQHYSSNDCGLFTLLNMEHFAFFWLSTAEPDVQSIERVLQAPGYNNEGGHSAALLRRALRSDHSPTSPWLMVKVFDLLITTVYCLLLRMFCVKHVETALWRPSQMYRRSIATRRTWSSSRTTGSWTS